MLIISGTDIKLTKGDTAHLIISAVLLDATTTEYVWSDTDIVYFSVRNKAVDYEPDVYLFRKTGALITEGDESHMTIDIIPGDTTELESGRHYFYDIIVFTDGNLNEKYTILNGDFELLGTPNRRWC